MGGLVTSHGAGMSVPDWPNTWGYNMFTFPVSKWVGGIWYEHTHRLVAALVGFMSLILVAIAWRTDKRAVYRWTAVVIVLGYLAQGILGGLRVVQSKKDLAILHGCGAQILFCFIASFCVMCSPLWNRQRELSADEIQSTGQIRSLAAITSAVIALQLVIGAIMRHSDAGLAIPDFPTSYGHLLPPTTIDQAFRQRAIHQFGLNLGLNRVTLFQIWIHFAHRAGAICVTAMVLWLVTFIARRDRRETLLSRPALILVGLLVTQLTLGILTVLLRKPADIASLHVAVGALVLVTAWVIAVRAHLILRRHRETSPVAADHHPTHLLQLTEANV
jgi:cytochrome c oxidase assembly protein subunit 15